MQPYYESPAYLAELDQVAAEVRDGRARFITDPDDDVVVLLVPTEMVEGLLGPLQVCDLCRLEWPAIVFDSVVWTDSHGEEWERRFCHICRDQQGLR